jgi:hypothetical protein
LKIVHHKLPHGQMFPGTEAVRGSGSRSLRENMTWAADALLKRSIASVISSWLSAGRQG